MNNDTEDMMNLIKIHHKDRQQHFIHEFINHKFHNNFINN